MIKNWIVNSSEELDSASSTSPAKESDKASSQEENNPQVSLLGLEVSCSVGCRALQAYKPQPGLVPPFPPLDAIPAFDLSAFESSFLPSAPQLPLDSLISLAFPDLDTAVGITPRPIAQNFPPMSQGVLLQDSTNNPVHKAPENVAPRRSNVLSSILIGSDAPSKCSSVRSTYMNVPKSALGRRHEQGERGGSKPSPPLSGSDAIKHRKFQSSYPFLPDSNGTSNKDQFGFLLDSIPTGPPTTSPFPPSNISLGNRPILSPLIDSSLSLSPFFVDGPFYNHQPAKFVSTDGLSIPPGYSDLPAPANQFGDFFTLSIPTTGPLITGSSRQVSSKTPSDAPLVNIENRSILQPTSSLPPTPVYDTKRPFAYEHRAKPVQSHKDAIRVLFGTHPLTCGERDTIERISGEQRKLIIKKKVDCDADGGTRMRR